MWSSRPTIRDDRVDLPHRRNPIGGPPLDGRRTGSTGGCEDEQPPRRRARGAQGRHRAVRRPGRDRPPSANGSTPRRSSSWSARRWPGSSARSRRSAEVKDLAGDGVLAFFGAPVAHEDDPERAVRAGLRIVEEIARTRARSSAAGASRASASGSASAPGRSCRRHRRRRARRVRGVRRHREHRGPAAVAGGAGHRPRRASDAIGSPSRVRRGATPRRLELKGKASRSSRASPGVAGADAVARRRLAGAEAPLVGRERELARVRARSRRRSPGGGGILFVTGEAGIGKSRLLAELRRRSRAAVGPRPRRSGSRAAASPTASRSPTGRSATSCGVARRRGRRAGAPGPGRAAPAASSGCSASAPARSTRTSARCSVSRSSPTRRPALAGALARGAAVPHVRGGRRAARPAGRGRAGRGRDRGPALGRPDVRAAPRAAAAATRGGGAAPGRPADRSATIPPGR